MWYYLEYIVLGDNRYLYSSVTTQYFFIIIFFFRKQIMYDLGHYGIKYDPIQQNILLKNS